MLLNQHRAAPVASVMMCSYHGTIRRFVHRDGKSYKRLIHRPRAPHMPFLTNICHAAMAERPGIDGDEHPGVPLMGALVHGRHVG